MSSPGSFFYGGQAVIEGVMMRGRKSLAIAVRKTNGDISIKEEQLSSVTQKLPILKWPFIRGTVALVEAMVIGVKALQYSASEYAEEEEEPLGAKEIVMTMGLSILLTIGIFVILPAYLLNFVKAQVASNFALNLIEGGIKLTLFIIYIAAISFMEDIRRVFQYHGAEHKAINCYEAGKELTVDNVKNHSLIHRRCGTSFIIFVLMTSIFIFSFFGRPPFLERVLLHLALLPVVSGISYEIIRLAGRERSPWIVRLISQPGLWTQKLTTREPSDDQIEVAIRSLNAVIGRDEGRAPDDVPQSVSVF